MTILVDVNLSPLWVPFFQQQGVQAIDWADVGSVNAPDADIVRFAAAHVPAEPMMATVRSSRVSSPADSGIRVSKSSSRMTTYTQ